MLGRMASRMSERQRTGSLAAERPANNTRDQRKGSHAVKRAGSAEAGMVGSATSSLPGHCMKGGLRAHSGRSALGRHHARVVSGGQCGSSAIKTVGGTAAVHEGDATMF